MIVTCWTRWLVGGLDHFLWFSIYWEFHHPNWRTHIFQSGRWTTNQMGMAWFFVELLRAYLCSFKIDGRWFFAGRTWVLVPCTVALSNNRGYPTPRMAIPMATMITDPWNYLVALWKTNITVENHHLSWVNQLFLWPCSIAILNYQRVYFPQQLRTRQIHTV